MFYLLSYLVIENEKYDEIKFICYDVMVLCDWMGVFEVFGYIYFLLGESYLV